MTDVPPVQRWLFGVALGGLMAILSTSAWGASFDCEKARLTVQKMICNDARLSTLDDRLNELIKEPASRAMHLNNDPAGWLATRKKCKTTKCIRRAYEKRIAFLTLGGPSGVGEPNIPGHYHENYSIGPNCLSIFPEGTGWVRYQLSTMGVTGDSCNSEGLGVWKDGGYEMIDSSPDYVCKFKMLVKPGSIQTAPPDRNDANGCQIACGFRADLWSTFSRDNKRLKRRKDCPSF